MKKLIALVLALTCLFSLVGCNTNSMNYIIEHKPSITGIIKEVNDNYIIICVETDSYPNGGIYKVSLDVKNQDGTYSPMTIGDEVTVYYNGEIAESYPAQINIVYAILLVEPTNRNQNNAS